MTVALRAERRTTPAIHQFHPGAVYGDAVTNGMLLTRRLLRGLGFASDVWVCDADPRLDDGVRDWRDYPASPANLLLVHHSLGHDHLERVLALPDRKVLVYHNVTPPEYFPDDPELRRYLALGREQLARYRTAVAGALCPSAFSAAELVALGYERVTVLPLLVDLERLRRAPWNAAVVEANAGRFTILFVGRVERNKCQHDVIEVFRRVDRWLGRPAQCVLVGRQNPCDPYVHELRQRAAALGLADRVRLPGAVPDDDLFGWYRAADVFLSMSEHEGFGVPLIEAMAFDVPVVAHASSSVPETLDGAGVLVEGKPIDEVAALLCLLADDRALRERIVERQRARCRTLSLERLRARLADELVALGVDVSEPPRRETRDEGEPCSPSTTRRSAQRS